MRRGETQGDKSVVIGEVHVSDGRPTGDFKEYTVFAGLKVEGTDDSFETAKEHAVAPAVESNGIGHGGGVHLSGVKFVGYWIGLDRMNRAGTAPPAGASSMDCKDMRERPYR